MAILGCPRLPALVALALALRPWGAQGARSDNDTERKSGSRAESKGMTFKSPVMQLLSKGVQGASAFSHEGPRRELGGYGQKSLKHLSKWWTDSVPWGNGTHVFKAVFCFCALVLFVGPWGSYLLVKSLLYAATHGMRMTSPLGRAIVDCLLRPLKCLSVLLCLRIVLSTVTGGVTRELPLIDDVRSLVAQLLECTVWWAPLRVLGRIDSALEEAVTERETSQTYQSRKQLLNDVAFGAQVVGPTQGGDGHGHFLFVFIWRPFYYISDFVIAITLIMALTGNTNQSFLLATGYILLSISLAVFGGQTLGPDLYGGLMLFMEQPFQEGDIITLDKPQTAGGARTDIVKSVVTGFVERIGVRSVTVRRFDMRAVWVPNSLFVNNPVANWNTRPRKLIFLEFAVSHRTPVESAKLFQEKMQYVVKNHPQVDQKQYSKSIFRAVNSGLKFVVICFNTRGSKKQVVQQDLIFRIVGLARKIGIRLTFDQQSLYVEREEIPDKAFYLAETFDKATEEGGDGAAPSFDELLPKKKVLDEAHLRRYAPKATIVVRLERVELSRELLGADAQAPDEGQAGGGPGDSDDDDDFSPDECSSKKVAYQMKLRPLKAEASVEVLTAEEVKQWLPPTRQSARSAQWTRRVIVGAAARELRFFENISFPFEAGSKANPLEHLPKCVDIQLFQVGKGIGSWARGKVAQVGVVVGDTRKLVTGGTAGKPHVLQLLDSESRVVGDLYAHVYVPEEQSTALHDQLEQDQDDVDDVDICQD